MSVLIFASFYEEQHIYTAMNAGCVNSQVVDQVAFLFPLLNARLCFIRADA
jgi:hypothetical protein